MNCKQFSIFSALMVSGVLLFGQSETYSSPVQSKDALPSLCDYSAAKQVVDRFAAMKEVQVCKLDMQALRYEFQTASKSIYNEFYEVVATLENQCIGKKVRLTPAMRLGISEELFEKEAARLQSIYGSDYKMHLDEIKK